jgi:4-amino-4-deoxy-L-arabinose transferase-like glycosyltransferase
MKFNLLSRTSLTSDTAILVYLAVAKLAVHLLTATGYGYFGDELYYLDAAKHIDFGYVDLPPLAPLIMAFSVLISGTSLFAIHILPAIAGAFTVFFAGLIARELGGGRFAQWLTALAVLAAPIWLVENSVFTYDPFDQLMTVILLYLSALIINREKSASWLYFGIAAGLGIMVKLSMLFTLCALLAATLMTSRRKYFSGRGPWLAMLISLAICVPFVLWQFAHGWPLLGYWQNYARYRNNTLPFEFLLSQTLTLNPVTLPVWLAGFAYLLGHREGKKYRILGLMHLILFGLFVYMKFDSRMLASACFPLLAAGSVFLEKTITGLSAHWPRMKWLGPSYAGILLLSSIWVAPIGLPALPISALVKYMKTNAGLIHMVKEDSWQIDSELPLEFAWRMGWPEIVGGVADVYNGLPESDRKNAAIYASNYAEAGAIDFYGKSYGLPSAISNHLSYQIWGPGQKKSDIMIAVGKGFPKAGDSSQSGLFRLSSMFGEVTLVATIKGNAYSVNFERDLPVYLCRKPKADLGEVWKRNEAFY